MTETTTPTHVTGDLALRLLDPVADLDLVHDWVRQPRAEFWGMRDKPREEVGEIYAWLQDQDHLCAYLVLVDGTPVGIFQTYDPAVDEIGRHYERREGDLGIHLFLADTAVRSGRTAQILRFLIGWVGAGGRVRRLVAEPDAANEASLARLDRLGFTAGPVAQLPDKVAQFFFLDVDGSAQPG